MAGKALCLLACERRKERAWSKQASQSVRQSVSQGFLFYGTTETQHGQTRKTPLTPALSLLFFQKKVSRGGRLTRRRNVNHTFPTILKGIKAPRFTQGTLFIMQPHSLLSGGERIAT